MECSNTSLTNINSNYNEESKSCGRPKKYHDDAERLEALKKRQKAYYERTRKARLDYKHDYYYSHIAEQQEYGRLYYQCKKETRTDG